jgi:hypothetical protein
MSGSCSPDVAVVLDTGGLEVEDGYADLMLLLPGDSAV